jgi:hypothetical protein
MVHFSSTEIQRGSTYIKKIFFLCMLYISLVSCSDKKEFGQYPVIDVINNIEKYQRVYCSDLFSSIELIPLETNDDCLVGSVGLLINDEFILTIGSSVLNNPHIYAFNRTGKFMNEIASRGQGPGEYLSAAGVFFNTEKSTVYIADTRKCQEYDLEGNYIRSFQLPVFSTGVFDITSRIGYIGGNLFIGSDRYNGNNKFKYCIFNQDGDTIKTFPNYIFFNRTGMSMSLFDFALNPISVDNRIYLKDYVNDTIYALTNLNLQPAYVFDFGKYSFSKEQLENTIMGKEFSNEFVNSSLIGFPNYFFYSLTRIGSTNVKRLFT